MGIKILQLSEGGYEITEGAAAPRHISECGYDSQNNQNIGDSQIFLTDMSGSTESRGYKFSEWTIQVEGSAEETVFTDLRAVAKALSGIGVTLKSSGSGGAGTTGGLTTTAFNTKQDELKTTIKTEIDENTAEVKKQGEDIITALGGQLTAPTRTFGRDDNNNTIIRQDVSADGITISYREASTGNPYTLIGNFIPDPTLSSQFGEKSTLLIANTTNALGGYNTDDIINKYEVIDLTDNNNVISTEYTNLTQDTVLVLANVDESELDPGSQKPRVVKTIDYIIVEDGTRIVDNAYRLIRDNNKHVWVGNDGSISESIITGGQELVRADLEISGSLEQPVAFPFIIEANTYKDLSIGVESGEYTISVNGGAPKTLKDDTFPISFDTSSVKNSWVNDTIVIDEVSAGRIVISGSLPGTLARLAANTGNTIDPQFYIDANSDFIIDASKNNFDINGVGDITRIDTLTETGTSDGFTMSQTGFKLENSPGGKLGFRSTAGSVSSFQKITPVLNNEEIRIVSLSMDTSDQGIKFKFTRFTTQISIQSTDISYNIMGVSFIQSPIANYGFSANELNGNEAFVMAVTRKLINSGNDYEVVFTIYNRANPNGIVVDTLTRPIGSSVQSLSFAPGSSWIHYTAAVSIEQETEVINIAKINAGI